MIESDLPFKLILGIALWIHPSDFISNFVQFIAFWKLKDIK
jgi:hypothetical protein